MAEDLQIESVDGVVVARIGGRFDGKAVSSMKDALKQLPTDAVALDMSAVNFIDSAALGLVVSLFRRVREAEGKFCLFGLQPPVMAIFELTRLHRTFDLYDDQAKALAALKG